MKKYIILYVFVLVMTCMMGCTYYPESNHAEKPPNILFILTDDQANWTLSINDNPNSFTPELDKLAEQGALFENAFATSAVCSPARASLITGRYPSETNIMDYIPVDSEIGMDTTLVTWPEVLQQNGYQTALIGKWHLGKNEKYLPNQRGYKFFVGFPVGGFKSKSPDVWSESEWKSIDGEYTPDVLTDLTIKQINSFHQQNKPFAISLHYWAPHANTQFPEGYQPPYDDRSWLPLKDEDLNYWLNRDAILPEPNFPELDVDRVKRMTREYHASVHSVDRNIGRIMNSLDQLGLTNNTIIIFTSDHGYMMGHHGLWHKGNGRWLTQNEKDPMGVYGSNRPNMYDYSLKVPAIVRWPDKIKPGTLINETISFLDWYPTILSMTGIKKPENVTLRGNNALPLLMGETTEGWDNNIFAQYKTLRTYRTPEWKLVRDFSDDGKDELYNLERDPNEKINLIQNTDESIQKKLDNLDSKMFDIMDAINDMLL
ncbi:sulfatase family protein [Rhodohalobacter sulfatireducens]|uniref:Sulfatase-like hydrolase/transferase n=1 Tax=Rhodohalobacter sulfatireducens TaxID=2911366 RepID=A0ABS9KAC3_9BACT|nr:sulfatase-like hydrolase/transferase [Rhodohalobacter sulfatireducens]MCG2587801.1 sulfatase-like hydrolase/transferase [Rhodohalobacter sulfatireducens]